MSLVIERREEAEFQYNLCHRLIENTKNYSSQLYTSYAPNNARLNKGIEKINTLSAPYLAKCAQLIDVRLDKTLKTIVPLKEKYLEMAANTTGRVRALGDSVRSNAETQVSTVLQKLNVPNLATSLKLNEFSPTETIVLIKENVNIKKLRELVKRLQEILYEVGSQSLYLPKRTQIEGLLSKLNERLNINENVEKVQLYSSVFFEIFKENVYQPSLNYSLFTYESGKNYVTLTLDKIRSTEFKKLIPELKEKFSYLRNGAIKYYQDKVVLTLDRESLWKNMDRIKGDFEDIVTQVRDFKSIDIKNNSQQIYEQTLKKIKDRKEGVRLRYKQVTDLVNEKKRELENSRKSVLREEK